MRHYIYRTTNLINGKFYYGYANDKSKCLSYYPKPYIGSGHALIKSIDKHGYDNFVREDLTELDNADEAFELERLIVDEDMVNNPESYNIALGGHGGNLGPEVNKKLSNHAKDRGYQGNNKIYIYTAISPKGEIYTSDGMPELARKIGLTKRQVYKRVHKLKKLSDWEITRVRK